MALENEIGSWQEAGEFRKQSNALRSVTSVCSKDHTPRRKSSRTLLGSKQCHTKRPLQSYLPFYQAGNISLQIKQSECKACRAFLLAFRDCAKVNNQLLSCVKIEGDLREAAEADSGLHRQPAESLSYQS